MNRRGFAPLFAVVAIAALLAVAAAAYWYWRGSVKKTDVGNAAALDRASSTAQVSSTPQSLSAHPGWKTFSNDQYGLTFQYPPDWTMDASIVSTAMPGESDLLVSLDQPTKRMTIRVMPNNFSHLSMEEWWKNEDATFNSPSGNAYEPYGTVDGIPAEWHIIFFPQTADVAGRELGFTKGKFAYDVTMETINDQRWGPADPNNQDLSAILQTFAVTLPPQLYAVDYHYPYPLEWKAGSADLFLTGAFIGYRTISSGTLSHTAEGSYKSEDVLALTLSIGTGKNATSGLFTSIKRITDESGDEVPPDMLISASDTQEVVYFVPEDGQEFLFRTGGASNKYFLFKIEDGSLKFDAPSTGG